jgi:hypothetical protein
MSGLIRNLNIVFAAGCLGGLINSLVLYACGAFGVNAAFGVKLAPALTPLWLYPRLVWGGIWGFLFLLPVLQSSWFRRGLVLSLGPTLVQLLVVFPFKTSQGYLGLELGLATPLLVLFFNAVWGWSAAIWLKLGGVCP